MAGFLFKLETPDGAPAEPSSFSSAVQNWAPGETIHFGYKTLRVVGVPKRTAQAENWIAICISAEHGGTRVRNRGGS